MAATTMASTDEQKIKDMKRDTRMKRNRMTARAYRERRAAEFEAAEAKVVELSAIVDTMRDALSRAAAGGASVPPVLLHLHGRVETSAAYRKIVNLLATTGPNVIEALDLHGLVGVRVL